MNQKLIDYLPDLITHFECVIIPEFGGFISEKKGASINSLGSIKAPNKSVLFNQQLNHNDGLLANYIAQKENISYAEAMELIKAEVDEMIEQLEKHQVLKINKIGEFKLLNDHIIFKADEQENFLIESFGLSSLEKAIENSPPQPELKIEEKKIEPKPEPTSQKNIRLVVIAVIILLAALAFYTLKDNIFKINKEITITDSASNENDSLQLLEDSLNQISEQIDTSNIINQSNTNTVNTNVNSATENNGNITEVVDTSSNKLSSTLYFIASASFKNEKDAIAEMRQLEMVGFDAEIIAMKNATPFQVVIGKYEKYQDAVKELKFAKSIDKKFYLLTVKENIK